MSKTFRQWPKCRCLDQHFVRCGGLGSCGRRFEVVPVYRSAMSDPPIIDHDHLARYTLGDRGLEREVLSLFIGQIPHTLDALDAAPDDEARVRAAHTLKGAARAVGAVKLGDIAARVERQARSGLPVNGLMRQELGAACWEVCEAILDTTCG